MLTQVEALTRPAPGGDYRAPSRYRPIALVGGLIGLMLAAVTLIANVVASSDLTSDPVGARETLAWSFGLTTAAFGTIKLGISIVLVGILVRLWFRITAVKESLAVLKPEAEAPAPRGALETEWGAATETADVSPPLPIHRMARTMWAPMVAMGYLLVLVGVGLSFMWSAGVADGTSIAASAWTQGTQFLGEAMLLAGISFLLGSILAALREGGGDVQKSLGLPVRTLKMPVTAKVFVVFMATGLMVGVAQFILYGFAATANSAQSFAAWSAWLGPLREFSLGLLLAGIVLALVTIGNVLAFQFNRIRGIVTTGA